MPNTTLFIDSNPLVRTESFRYANGTILDPLSWIFADIFPVTVTMLGTGSYFNGTTGTSAKIGIGIPGNSALALSDLGIVDDSSYSGSVYLNTYELSASLGTLKQKDFQVEVQITSGSQIVSYQHSLAIERDIISNALVHVTGSVIVISASYSDFALSASLASRCISASHADTADQVSFGDYLQEDPPISNFMLVRGYGGPLISMGQQNLVAQLNAAGLSVYDESIDSAPDREIIRISPSTTWFSGSNNFGIGVSSPDGDPYNKLQVAGNISCSAITASNLLGTATIAKAVYQSNTDSLIKLDVDRPNLGPTSPILLLSASNHDVGAYNANAIDISNENYTEAFHYEVGSGFYMLGAASSRFAIGTDTPTEKVHIVSGSILAEGDFPLLTLQDGGVSAVLSTADLTISDIALGSIAVAITAPDNYINLYDGSGNLINFSTNGTSYISNSFNFGLGTQTPTAKLHVIGNIIATSVTASLKGTASWAITASHALNALTALTANTATTANTISFVPEAAKSASWVSASAFITTAQTASFVTASNVVGVVTSASYAITSSNVSGQSVCNQYALSSGYINYYTASITASANDNGRTVCINTASNYILTGSLDSNFSCMVFQSGSGKITITGSGVPARNVNSQYQTGGQWALASIIRVASGDFIIGGSTS